MCNDDSIVRANVEEVKIRSPDYDSFRPDDAAGMYWRIPPPACIDCKPVRFLAMVMLGGRRMLFFFLLIRVRAEP